AMELLAARLDTSLWLALPQGGSAPPPAGNTEELARIALETPSLLIPWVLATGGKQQVVRGVALLEKLSLLAPREREQLSSARTRALVALVAEARLGRQTPSPLAVDLLLTLILDPFQLLVGGSVPWGSAEGQRRITRFAAQAVCRAHPKQEGSLGPVLLDWLQRNPDADLAGSASSSSTDSFEAFFQRWPQHRNGDALGVAERMSAFVDGLEILQEELASEPGALWRLLFHRWPGGVEAMLASWRHSASWRAASKREKRSAASQLLEQALVRFLLVAVPPSLPSQPAGGSTEAAAISALLCLPRPPVEAAPRLLRFFAARAQLVFEISRPWPPGQKRALLTWLCDFAGLASAEGGAEPAQSQVKSAKAGDGTDFGSEEAGPPSVAYGPALQGSVLAEVDCGLHNSSASGSSTGQAEGLPEAFARLLSQLPLWLEWAVSDAAHGGADDEDAPPAPRQAKRARKDATSQGLASAMVRVQQARADRT
ncbi:unnamed protein product, partial [Polarella glacialis]